MDLTFISRVSVPRSFSSSFMVIYLSLIHIYFGALQAAQKIYLLLDDPAMADRCARQAARLKAAANSLLYDGDRGLYFEGLTTPTPEPLIAPYMPQNTQKRCV